MAFLLGGANSASGGYNIDNSLRFNDDDSAYLEKTFGSSGNRKTLTVSCWIKRATLSTLQTIISACPNGSSTGDDISFQSSDKLMVDLITSSGRYQALSSAVFRDVSAWYHVVVKIDTTQASNRMLTYVNNEQVAVNSGGIPQNEDITFSSDTLHNIGRRSVNNGSPADYYMSDFHFIDGSALAPTEFGETNDNGVWIPKAYDGSYGTNGFFLEFQQTGTSQNSSGMGADTSGNDNHFAVTNLAATDITTDTPTNNFMTMNPLSQYGISFSEGNLSVQGASSSGYSVCTGGWEVPSNGKWYYEVEVDVFGGTNHEYLGIKRDDLTLAASAYDLHSSTCQWYQSTDGSNGSFRDESSTTATATALRHSAGDILMVAIDISNEKMWFGKNGTWYDDDATTDGDPANGTNPTCTPNNDYTWHFFSGGGNNAVKYLYNFGNPPFAISSGNTDGLYGNFEYAPPSGYYALCTKRLAEFG